ncbi:MAG: ribulose-phosphate 3-epimerase [Solobacterium sp.]|nr:ribulose-phosphate 3-epimerase [Solobacterium sp.]
MIVAPSVLSLDYANTKEQLDALAASKAEWMHFDVMDGHFVPNLSFGPDILKGFVKGSKLIKDVHLMVEDPSYFAEVFAEAGADYITFHYEALDGDHEKIMALIKKIHDLGCKVGLSIKPKTDVMVLKEYIHDVDLFLIMSVEPGYGGQAFMEDALERIEILKLWIKDDDSKALIEVDGGINEETGRACAQKGVDILVAGSYVFKNDIVEMVEKLWKL